MTLEMFPMNFIDHLIFDKCIRMYFKNGSVAPQFQEGGIFESLAVFPSRGRQ